jgi:hypothetical protein
MDKLISFKINLTPSKMIGLTESRRFGDNDPVPPVPIEKMADANQPNLFSPFFDAIKMAVVMPRYWLIIAKIRRAISAAQGEELDRISPCLVNLPFMTLTKPLSQTLELFNAGMQKSGIEAMETGQEIFNLLSELHTEATQELMTGGVNALSNFVDELEKVFYQVTQRIKDVQAEMRKNNELGLASTEKEKVLETPAFTLWSITPDEDTATEFADCPTEQCNPILFLHPIVLGSDALSLSKDISLVKEAANQGVPVFVLEIKDIQTTEAVQDLDMQKWTDQIRQATAFLSEKFGGKSVHEVGLCQSGQAVLADAAESEGDPNVKYATTIVTPHAGGKKDVNFFFDAINELPPAYRNLEAAEITAPSGKKIIPGKILKSTFDNFDSAIISLTKQFIKNFRAERDLDPEKRVLLETKIKKIAAIQHYLGQYEANDQPVRTTEWAFALNQKGINEQGDFPMPLGEESININNISENLKHLQIIYASKDTLVPKENAIGIFEEHLAEMIEEGRLTLVEIPGGHLNAMSNPKKVGIPPILDLHAKLVRSENEERRRKVAAAAKEEFSKLVN